MFVVVAVGEDSHVPRAILRGEKREEDANWHFLTHEPLTHEPFLRSIA